MVSVIPIKTFKQLYHTLQEDRTLQKDSDVTALEKKFGVSTIDELVRKCSQIIQKANDNHPFEQIKSVETWFSELKGRIREIKEGEEDLEFSKKNFLTRIAIYCWRYFFGRGSAAKITKLEKLIQSDIDILKFIETAAWKKRKNEFEQSGKNLLEKCIQTYDSDINAQTHYRDSLTQRELLNSKKPKNEQFTDPNNYFANMFEPFLFQRNAMDVPFYTMRRFIINSLEDLFKKYSSFLQMPIQTDKPHQARAFIYALLGYRTSTILFNSNMLFNKDPLLVGLIKEFVTNPELYFTPNEEQQKLCTALSQAITQIETGKL